MTWKLVALYSRKNLPVSSKHHTCKIFLCAPFPFIPCSSILFPFPPAVFPPCPLSHMTLYFMCLSFAVYFHVLVPLCGILSCCLCPQLLSSRAALSILRGVEQARIVLFPGLPGPRSLCAEFFLAVF